MCEYLNHLSSVDTDCGLRSYNASAGLISFSFNLPFVDLVLRPCRNISFHTFFFGKTPPG